jgi:hypothetical protein
MNDATSGTYISREQAAQMLNVSIGGLASAMERGELDGMFIRINRSVRFCRPALALRALGVTDVGVFCRSLGITDLPSLVAFLAGPGVEESLTSRKGPAECETRSGRERRL